MPCSPVPASCLYPCDLTDAEWASLAPLLPEPAPRGRPRRWALRRLLTDYFHYYHDWRTHRALDMDCPLPRPVQRPEVGPIREVPEVGGLHHHYERRAA